jgi:hypothetical protein
MAEALLNKLVPHLATSDEAFKKIIVDRVLNDPVGPKGERES